jgi:hypothetical protein
MPVLTNNVETKPILESVLPTSATSVSSGASLLYDGEIQSGRFGYPDFGYPD